MGKKIEPAGCHAGGHRWETVRFTVNYRRCWRCERLEVFVDDHWVVPTPARKKRSSSPSAAAYIPLMWTTLIGVSYQDLQIKSSTSLFGPRSGADASTTQTRRARIGQLLEAAAGCGYPDVCVYLPGERRYTINAGLASWQLVCEHGAPEVIDGALSQLVSYQELPVVVESERAGREALVEYGCRREWQGYVFKMRNQGTSYEFDLIIGDSEQDWKRFAYRGYYDQMLEACRRLQAEEERAKRDAVLVYGKACGWRRVVKRASAEGQYVVFGEEGEMEWRRFAGQAPSHEICRLYDLLVMYEGPLEVIMKEMGSSALEEMAQ